MKELKEKYQVPVVYLTGTVGGLMTSLKVPVRGDNGMPLADGTFEKTDRYGRLVGRCAVKAIEQAQPLRLTPLAVHSRTVYLPLDNPLVFDGPAASGTGAESLCLDWRSVPGQTIDRQRPPAAALPAKRNRLAAAGRFEHCGHTRRNLPGAGAR